MRGSNLKLQFNLNLNFKVIDELDEISQKAFDQVANSNNNDGGDGKSNEK
jgi:hypothetical protein